VGFVKGVVFLNRLGASRLNPGQTERSVGRAPTGQPVEEWVVTNMHFGGDEVVREWIGADKLGLFIQLGGLDDRWSN